MKIAIPVTGEKLARHFGHCEHFALLDVNKAEKKIVGREMVEAPPHQPGLLPLWLAEKGTEVVIAGGMGQRAIQLFAQNNIAVLTGVSGDTPEEIVSSYMEGTLKMGENVCDH